MRQSFRMVLLAAAAVSLHAHFSWVVPDPGADRARLFLSETLEPDPQVDADILRGARLSLRDASGRETPLTLVGTGEIFTTSLPGSSQRLVHGLADLGLMSRSEPYLLLYYPKTILGDPFDVRSRVGDSAVVELVPQGRAGAVRLQLLVHGKPQADAEITLVLPDGTQTVVKTDARGETEAFASSGRYGAWARFWEAASGERDGAKYTQVRHYAMLVFDAEAQVPASGAAGPTITAAHFATMPQPSASFGAAILDDWLYIYGGHVAPTHVYSTSAVSGRFDRLRLAGDPVWEELPGGPPLQGMNLTAHDGWIYRIGGMAPANDPSQPANNQSVAENARFDPRTRRWENLPPLPEPRSSHDPVVIGDQLIVVGGWALNGRQETWSDTILTLNLAAEELEWRSEPQPFRRRALMAAAFREKVYVVGGIAETGAIVRDVSIYDPRTKTWTEGPPIPEGPGIAFAPAVAVHNGRLYVSVSDGTLWRLNEAGSAWEKAGSATPRVAHRLASSGDRVLVIGGAADGKNSDLIEAIPVGQ